MLPQTPRRRDRLMLWLIVVMIVSGCSSRGTMSSGEDPASQASPPPTPMAAAAPVSPPKQDEPELRVEEEPVATVAPVELSPPPQEPPEELSDVYFDFDRYAIRLDARSTLAQLARQLKSKPSQALVIEGHCDERGTSAYNLVLGERRAQAVKQFLKEQGLSMSQIRVTSYGKERPICTERSEACWQSNRRVHFRRP